MRSVIMSSMLVAGLWAASPIGGVSVVVKNSAITLYDVSQTMVKNQLNATQSVDLLIRQRLEELDAQEKKITISATEVDQEMRRMADQNHLSLQEFMNVMQIQQQLNEKSLRQKIEENLRRQKLYSTIAYSKMSAPSAQEEAEYYQLHIQEFSKPERIRLSAYYSSSREDLGKKIANPMYHIASVTTREDTMEYTKLNPQLAQVLNGVQVGRFSPIFPSGEGFVSFYVQEKINLKTLPLEQVRSIVSNAIMEDRRNQILDDYFARLKLNAEITIVRLPQ